MLNPVTSKRVVLRRFWLSGLLMPAAIGCATAPSVRPDQMGVSAEVRNLPLTVANDRPVSDDSPARSNSSVRDNNRKRLSGARPSPAEPTASAAPSIRRKSMLAVTMASHVEGQPLELSSAGKSSGTVLENAPALRLDAETDLPTVDSQAPDSLEQASQLIDLASALGMAGGNAWTIHLARQRTVDAHANVLQAQARWLPTLQFGMGWNKHDGRIQNTNGQVIEASRNSFFLGGGSTWGVAPTAGGSGGPLRLSADLALADAYFASKIAERRLYAERFGVSVAKNAALLDAGLAYVDLLDAASRVADAQAAMGTVEQLVSLTQAFADAGAGAAADVDRARAEEAGLTQELQNAQRALRVRSATLARRLRLDPRMPLQPADQLLVAIQLCEPGLEMEDHIATAMATRPEFAQFSNQIAAGCLELRQAEVEPWIPKVAMATSAGSFGGGTGSDYENNGGRSDIDIQAVWELDSLGYGVVARRQRARSRIAQDRIRLADLRDEVTAEVVRAYEEIVNYELQIQSAETTLERAESSYQRNLQRVRAGEGLPIELLQAIQARASGLRARTRAVSGYNRAQLRLLFATGQLKR